MLANYFKTTYRNVIKNKTYTFINVFSLAIGLACCILLLIYIQDELSYDRHHRDYEKIYRIKSVSQGKVSKALQVPFGDLFNKENDDIITARIHKAYNFTFRINGEEKHFDHIYFGDAEFIDIYSLDFIEGDRTALRDMNSVIVSESTAKRYFAVGKALGAALEGFGESRIVRGVFKDFPANSHARYNIFFKSDFSDAYAGGSDAWGVVYPQTYVKLGEHLNVQDLKDRLAQFTQKYLLPRPTTPPDFKYIPEPITDIHLSGPGRDFGRNSSYGKINLMAVICLIVLLIACINFMNLATARAAKRAKEVGIRKTIGTARAGLVFQFLSESLFITFLAFALAMAIVSLFLPEFNRYFDKSIAGIFDFDPTVYLSIIGLYLFVGIGAGLYPAFYLSKFNPIEVLKGTSGISFRDSRSIRQKLVVVQFAMSTILIIAAYIILSQIHYLQSKPLGYDQENIAVVDLLHQSPRTKSEVFRAELLRSTAVANVSLTQNQPVAFYFPKHVWLPEADENDFFVFESAFVDEDFFQTFAIDFESGRGYSKGYSTDAAASVILNQAAVRKLGIRGSPIGQRIYESDPNRNDRVSRTIIGVIRDFHSRPLTQEIAPLMILLQSPQAQTRYAIIKTRGENPERAIENIFKKVYPDLEFNYLKYSDLNYAYNEQQRLSQIVNVFGVIAIVISCAGLFGLISFTAEQKRKEISVRKVLGASTVQSMLVFIKEFGRLILVANLIACPIAFYVMKSWMANFPYQAGINLLPFMNAISSSVIITALTIGYHVYKSAIANPVNALKCE
ncbi:MAG: FtsX-like permease family protein [bacterium]